MSADVAKREANPRRFCDDPFPPPAPEKNKKSTEWISRDAQNLFAQRAIGQVLGKKILGKPKAFPLSKINPVHSAAKFTPNVTGDPKGLFALSSQNQTSFRQTDPSGGSSKDGKGEGKGKGKKGGITMENNPEKANQNGTRMTGMGGVKDVNKRKRG